jgi:hypothetical protein
MKRIPKLEKDEIIKAFKSSGMKQAAWCAQNGVSIHNLRYWLGKKQHPVLPAAGDMQWVSLNVMEDRPQPSQQGVHVQIGTVTVIVLPDFDPNHLLGVLRTVIAL